MKTGLFADLSEEDKEIAEYGLKQGLILIGGLILAVAVGWLLGIPGQAVLFLLLAYILRIFAGGYHATTPARCGVISAIFILICFLCIKYITLPQVVKLDEKEEQVYGRMARRIVLAEFGIYLISALLGWKPGTRCVSVCLSLMAVNLAVGLANKKRRRRLDHDENPDL